MYDKFTPVSLRLPGRSGMIDIVSCVCECAGGAVVLRAGALDVPDCPTYWLLCNIWPVSRMALLSCGAWAAGQYIVCQNIEQVG